MTANGRVGDDRRGSCEAYVDIAFAHGIGEPSEAGVNASRLPAELIVFLRWHEPWAHHQTVQRRVERALAYGPLVALDRTPPSDQKRGWGSGFSVNLFL